MEPRELIARLEALGQQQDAVTAELIAALKEWQAATDALFELEQRRLEQRGAAASVVVEAAFALDDANGARRRDTLRRRLFGGFALS